MGMVNFSVVGDATMEQRKVYEEYDAEFKARKLLPNFLRSREHRVCNRRCCEYRYI